MDDSGQWLPLLIATTASALLPMISEHAVAGEARLAALPTAHRLADVVNAANVNHVVLPRLEDLAAKLTDVLKATNATQS